jgi:hypothetical protein
VRSSQRRKPQGLEAPSLGLEQKAVWGCFVKLEDFRVGMEVQAQNGERYIVLAIESAWDSQTLPIRANHKENYTVHYFFPSDLVATTEPFEVSADVAKGILMHCGYKVGEGFDNGFKWFETLQEAWNDFTDKFGAP